MRSIKLAKNSPERLVRRRGPSNCNAFAVATCCSCDVSVSLSTVLCGDRVELLDVNECLTFVSIYDDVSVCWRRGGVQQDRSGVVSRGRSHDARSTRPIRQRHCVSSVR